MTLEPFEVEVFYDGDCPICSREIEMIRRMDRHARIRFTNIVAPEFDPRPLRLTMDELMAHIRGRLPDGSMIQGVEVFRRLYAAVGFRRIVAASRLPGISQLLDAGYAIFARYRLRLTGRCTNAESCARSTRVQGAQTPRM